MKNITFDTGEFKEERTSAWLVGLLLSFLTSSDQ
jgi:hypothetical protein